ncbi:DUF401 family protein [Oscillospiraceae bacterium OttesenSCG-928-G22]|nr:DUF401 family protein [Oscillospiraceae bacterium OttesenSCG-928-G22]
MDVLKLLAVLGVIVLAVNLKRPLYQAVLAAMVAVGFLFQMGFLNFFTQVLQGMINPDTWLVILAFYLIAYLQRMLERRGLTKLAQQSLGGLFNSRRVTVSLAPVFLGLLPAPGVVPICGEIVEGTLGDDMKPVEKAFITTYYRHIPESFLPTFMAVLLGIKLSGTVSIRSFMITMLPMVGVLLALGYIFYLRRFNKETGAPPSTDKRSDAISLFQSLWSIALAVLLIVAFNLPVYLAVLVSIVLSAFVGRFTIFELGQLFLPAIETRLLLNTFCILVFKDVLSSTGAIERLPAVFEQLPIPQFLVFSLLFFFGGLMSGSQAIVALCMPLAFATVKGAGAPLLVLLMGMTYAANQVSPTHVCLGISSEYFHVSIGALIKRTLPIMLIFMTVLHLYYLLLVQFV